MVVVVVVVEMDPGIRRQIRDSVFGSAVVYSYAYIPIYMQNTYWRNNNDERHSLLEKYLSHFIWKGCVCEREVGDWTEL